MGHEAEIVCKTCNKKHDESFKFDYIDDLIKLYVKILRENFEILEKMPFVIQIECHINLSGFIYEHIKHEIYIIGEYEDDPEIKL